MNEYLRQITRLLKINGDSMEGMMVVNRDGIIEYYKASSAWKNCRMISDGRCVGNICWKSIRT